MASRWADRLPVVTAPWSSTPKRITFIYPFYENHEFFRRQLRIWGSYPTDLKRLLRVIVVDDGSPSPCVIPTPATCAIRLFRISVDVRWNWLAARNIGAQHADDGWLLFTDMDHVVPESTLGNIVNSTHDPSVAYAFSRREYDGTSVPPHSASFLITRSLFWKVGGYDEALSGYYGTDGDFRRRLRVHAPINVLTDTLIRYEQYGDSSTVRYGRKEPKDDAVRALVAARKPGWRPRVLSFPYTEVGC